MKKSIALILALLMLLPLAACKKPAGINDETPAPTDQQAALPTEEPANSEEPAITEEPVQTEEPTEAPTEEPAVTEAPTEEPTAAPTEEPEAMIPEMIIGMNCVFLLYPNGELWGWGKNEYGQLGDDSTEDRLSPVKIMEDVKSVVTDYCSVFAIKNDLSLWAWGYNSTGCLGVGSSDEIVKKPAKVTDDVVKVVTYNSYKTRILHSDGTLDIAGAKTYWAGEHDSSPVQALTGVADMGVDIALLNNGKLVTIMEGETIDTSVASFIDRLSDDEVVYIKTDGTLWIDRNWDDDSETVECVDDNVASVHCYPDGLMELVYGYEYYYMKNNGELWYFEYDYESEKPETKLKLSNVAKLAIGGYESGYEPVPLLLAITEGGELYSWTNEWGSSAYLSAMGLEEEDLKEPYDEPRQVLSGVAAAFTNGLSSYAIKEDGTLWGCGKVVKGVYKGGVGDGNYETVMTFKQIFEGVESVYQILIYDLDPEDDSDEPTYIYATTRYAVCSDGSVWAWGSGENGLIGNGGTKRADSPVKIMDPKYS